MRDRYDYTWMWVAMLVLTMGFIMAIFGCASAPVIPKSCLFPEFPENRCPTNHVCRYVQNETNPEFLHGEYRCVPIYPSLAPEAR